MARSGKEMAETQTDSEASGSGESRDPNNFFRKKYGTGRDDVEQTTQLATERAYCVAGLSGSEDGFLQIMLAEVEYMLDTPELRHSSLCCSFVLRCAEEFEVTHRPRLALARYKQAQELASKDSDMKDMLICASSRIKKVMAGGTTSDSGSRTWDSLPRRFIHGPYYVDYRHYEWVYDFSDGRRSVEEITFSLCDFAQKQAGGDEDEYMQRMMKHVEELEREPGYRGSPVHCSVILHCARQFKKMGQLEEAVKLFRQALEFATKNPQGMNQVRKQSCDDLAMIFSGELQPEDRRRFLELIGVPTLWSIGNSCFDSSNFEEAINCYTDCLVMDSSFASRCFYVLAPAYEACQDHQAALILVEQARLASEVENCQCNWPQIDHGLDRTYKILQCPRHHVLLWTLLEQGRLQCRYWSQEEAKTTLEKGLQLAKEFGNKYLVRLIEKEILEILIRQHNDSTFMSGNFSFASAERERTIENAFQKFRDDELEFSRTHPLEYYSNNSYEYYSERSQHLSEFIKAGPYYNDDMVQRKLEHDMKEVAKYETCDDDDHFSKGFRLCNAHIDVLQDLKVLRRSGQEMKHHFKEAVEAAKEWSDREDMDALNMRLFLVSLALDIQEFGEAEALSKGVIHVLEKKLNQFVCMSHEHALRFLEITKHAYTSLICTYHRLASAKNKDGFQRLDEPHLEEYMQKSLLWAERLKGRLLMKLLDHPVTSTSGDAIRIPSYDDKHTWTCEATLSDTKFHGDDDWAMNYLFHPSDELLHHGSKMLFVSYTILPQDLLQISFVNSVDGSVVGFGHKFLNKVIDKETRKLAEDELDILKTDLHNYKNSDESTTPNRKNEVCVPCIPRISSSLYAMNKPGSRMRYYNPWIPGLVARIQRLAYEAQQKRASLGDRSIKDAIDQIVNEIDSLLRKLYEILIGPEIGYGLREAMEKLGADYTLVFLPHEDLSVVPFQALRDERGKYLIEQYPVAVSPSMWVARHCQHLYHEQLKSPPGPKLLVGRETGYPAGFEDLKGAHTEIAKIKENCGQNCCEVLDDSGDAAERPMKERVMQHAQTASWAHFAVHGEISPSFPRGSLLLGDTASTRWSSDEITASGFPCARSVVLSACQSGLGTLGGEGVLGFARAFLRAGVPSCVVSMWQVTESFCLGFMDQLYTYLHGGEDLAHAMQKSILHLMKEERKPLRKRDPPIPKWLVLDWASFSCIGYAGVKFPGTLDSPNDRAEPEHRNPKFCRVTYISIRDDQITSREELEENISVSQPSTSASPDGKDVADGVHVDDSFSKVRENDRNAVKETSGLWKLDELLTLGKECLDRGRSGDALQKSRKILETYMSLICKHRRQLDSRPDLHTAIGDFASWFLYVLFHLEDFEECIRWFSVGISREDALKESLEGSGSVQYNVAVSFLKRSVVDPDLQNLQTSDNFNEDFIEKGREFLKKSCQLQVEYLDSLVFQPALITVGFQKETGMFASLGRVVVVPVEMFEKLLGTPYSHFKEQQVMHLLDDVVANVIAMKDDGFHVEAEAVRRMGVTFGSKIEEEEMRNRFLVSLSDIAL